MARRRQGEIGESIQELERLQERYRGCPEEYRITMLRLLKEQPDRGTDDIAVQVGYSVASVKRWWRMYRSGGIAGLLGDIRGRTRGEEDGLVALGRKLAAGEFAGLDDVVEWAMGEGAVPRRVVEAVDGPVENSRSVSGNMEAPPLGRAPLPGYALQFLQRLPVSSDPVTWVENLRDLLKAFLGDVDHVTVTLNSLCDLLDPQGYKPAQIVSQKVETGAINVTNYKLGKDLNDDVHLQRTLVALQGNGFDLNQYHPPISYVLYYQESAYLGLLILWRERTRPVISHYTQWLMEQLRPFWIFMFADFVTRNHYMQPAGSVLNKSIEDLFKEAGLSMQERRIMLLQILGYSYDEMASNLHISTNTLRHHLRSIYRKTDTHGLVDLIAKYFSPMTNGRKAR